MKLMEMGTLDKNAAHFIVKALFTTITNASWDDDGIINLIKEGFKVRDTVKKGLESPFRVRFQIVQPELLMTMKPSWPKL